MSLIKLDYNSNYLIIGIKYNKYFLISNIKKNIFDIIDFYDHYKLITWNLIQNKNEVIQQKKDNNGQNLFSNVAMEVATKVYLLPEFKKVDYFLI